VHADVLDLRALNRATLARQMLLQRAQISVGDAVRALAGMQAQAPLTPHIGLWTRLRDYDPAQLDALYTARQVARITVMRNTVHLVAAQDALAWRALVAPLLQRATDSAWRRGYPPGGLPLPQLTEAAHELLRERPLTSVELGRQLAQRFADGDPTALSYAARCRLALVQIPPRGLWGRTGPVAFTDAQEWFAAGASQPHAAQASAQEHRAHLVLRYLAAFGPATPADAQRWSGLSRLAAVFAELRDRLVEFRAPDGTVLYDLPDAPRPPAESPAPVRFLPAYDNLLLGYDDRRRVNPQGRAVPLPPGNGADRGSVLVDGTWCGGWHAQPGQPGQPGGTLTVACFAEPGAAARDELEREGLALLRFLAPHADVPCVRIVLDA
jgi:hypothetical protein